MLFRSTSTAMGTVNCNHGCTGNLSITSPGNNSRNGVFGDEQISDRQAMLVMVMCC